MEIIDKQIQVIKANTGSAAPRRVAAYCRVSNSAEEHINSFFAQVQYYNDYIRANKDMTLVDIYADEGITGTSMKKRKEFLRMMKDAHDKKLDTILVKSITRFARNSLECLEAIRKLKSDGVNVIFENDGIDTAKMDSEIIVYIKSAFAQSEATSASKRMRTSVRLRMESGMYTVPTVAYGYKKVGDVWEINESEAKIVRQIFEWYLSGYGSLAIANKLKTLFPNDCWNNTRVRYILSNEKYIGDCKYPKVVTESNIPLKTVRNVGQYPMFYVENTHAPIIDAEVFEKVQLILAERKERIYRPAVHNESVFEKKVYCSKCGSTFRKKKRNDELFWTCINKNRMGGDCKSLIYSTKELQRAFIKMYNILKQNAHAIVDESISQLVALKAKLTSANRTIASIDAEIASSLEQLNLYTDLYNSGIITELIYIEKQAKFKKQLLDLRERRGKVLNKDEQEQCIEKLRELKRYLENSPQYLSTMDDEMFTELVSKIYAEQDGALTFELKCELRLSVYIRGGYEK